jgi:hypothetical protein
MKVFFSIEKLAVKLVIQPQTHPRHLRDEPTDVACYAHIRDEMPLFIC